MSYFMRFCCLKDLKQTLEGLQPQTRWRWLAADVCVTSTSRKSRRPGHARKQPPKAPAGAESLEASWLADFWHGSDLLTQDTAEKGTDDRSTQGLIQARLR